ncbi:hypothetical protein BU15DRAFT_61630 [Melanogaster broomeanus]|nr:hypothetical protein BU15DRAFT_61630 [Melanogaster broomeanus]
MTLICKTLIYNVLKLVAILLGQILIFAFACAFLGAELYHQCVSFNSSLTRLIQQNPKISTTVVTLIATALTFASSVLFGLAVKDAMRHKMSEPTSVIQVSTGIALAQGSVVSKKGCGTYFMYSLITWIIFGLLDLLTTGWTTLLMPTLVNCRFQVSGTELDLSSPAFAQLLQGDLLDYSPFQINDDSFPIINIGGSLSGISAAGTSFALPGTFNFNGAKYNVSTGGVLPAIRDYAGSAQNRAFNETRLSFAGGHVLTNTSFHPVVSAAWGGELGQAYNVSAWDSTANCNGSSTSIQQYVTLPGNGFLPSVVCPGQRNESIQSFQKFIIATQGLYRYNFLDSTVCEVTPLLTTVRVNYSSEIIEASSIVESRPFDSSNSDLLLFLASIASYEGREAQGMLTNSIGDALVSIYSATTNVTSPIEDGTEQVYAELENYWRGAIEFSATYVVPSIWLLGCRIFPNDIIPSDLTTPINGTMLMLTMGWADRGAVYLFSVLPLGLITLLTILTVGYSFMGLYGKGRKGPTQAHVKAFDVTDTLHLVTACAAGGVTTETGSREFKDFTTKGLKENEAIKLVLREHGNEKKLVVVPQDSAGTDGSDGTSRSGTRELKGQGGSNV